jgi:hypothetical protein
MIQHVAVLAVQIGLSEDPLVRLESADMLVFFLLEELVINEQLQ